MSFSFIKMRANTACLLAYYNVCLVVTNISFNILYACGIAPGYSHAMWCNNQCLPKLNWLMKRMQKMVYNIRKMVSNIHMYNILSKTIWKLTRIALGYSHAIWCNNQCLPTSSRRLEIPMSHQKCFQTIGEAQPRPRVCYINDCKLEKSSLEQWENIQT